MIIICKLQYDKIDNISFMKLNEFIANVLQDIDARLQQAETNTGRKYSVKVTEGGGVSFDIAVTTVNATGTHAEGQAKAGFIEVLGVELGAKLEGKMEDKTENSAVSRIQFTIDVPFRTKQEEEEHRAKVEASRQQAVERARNIDCCIDC